MAVRHKVDSIKQIKEREELEIRMAETPDDVEQVREDVGLLEDALVEMTELLVG